MNEEIDSNMETLQKIKHFKRKGTSKLYYRGS
jgi:hypothetical protein